MEASWRWKWCRCHNKLRALFSLHPVSSPPATYRRRLRKGPRIVLALLAVFAAVALTTRFIVPLFERPTFTLFVHSTEANRDPSRIVAVVHASREKAWADVAANPSSSEKLLWMEQVGGGPTQRLFGSYAVRENELVFTPSAPLVTGAMYHIVFLPPGLSEADSAKAFRTGFGTVSGKGKLELIHQVPASSSTAAPTIESVHPTSDSLPTNHLKFYITFSEPMEHGVFMERIKMLRGDGSEIAGPFRETELWSPDGKRLTVWLHPGRQKTGVNLNESEGPVLKDGDSITLLISGGWRAASGQKLGADFKRSYRVTKADHERVDPSKWTVQAPKANTREPLRLTFPKPLDWALLQDSIAVLSSNGGAVAGLIGDGDGERTWSFMSNASWSAGDYSISIKPELEDLAGNNLAGPFELDVSSSSGKSEPSVTKLSFHVE